jgi:precorrin-2 dehydrogenase/sirohydrochlorin ferrochelatase
MLRLRDRRCLVVGAGPVGLRKAKGLLDAGAEVVLVDPRLASIDVPAEVQGMPRAFNASDLDGACLAFAATGEPEVNQGVAEAARQKGVPVNIADDPDGSDFTLPASFSNGDLTVSAATGGGSPAVAALVRDELEKGLAEEWMTFLEIAAKLRSRRLTSSSKSAYNQQVLQNLVSGGMLAKIRDLDEDGIDRLLETEFGAGCSLAELEVSLPKGSS